MRRESRILGGQRRVLERRRHAIRREPLAAQALGRPGFEQHFTVAVEDRRGHTRVFVEETGGQRAAPQPRSRGGDRQRRPEPAPTNQAAEETLHLIVTVAGALRPFTSGAYISSAHAPAAANTPAVVARTTYENS